MARHGSIDDHRLRLLNIGSYPPLVHSQLNDIWRFAGQIVVTMSANGRYLTYKSMEWGIKVIEMTDQHGWSSSLRCIGKFDSARGCTQFKFLFQDGILLAKFPNRVTMYRLDNGSQMTFDMRDLRSQAFPDITRTQIAMQETASLDS